MEPGERESLILVPQFDLFRFTSNMPKGNYVWLNCTKISKTDLIRSYPHLMERGWDVRRGFFRVIKEICFKGILFVLILNFTFDFLVLCQRRLWCGPNDPHSFFSLYAWRMSRTRKSKWNLQNYLLRESEALRRSHTKSQSTFSKRLTQMFVLKMWPFSFPHTKVCFIFLEVKVCYSWACHRVCIREKRAWILGQAHIWKGKIPLAQNRL